MEAAQLLLTSCLVPCCTTVDAIDARSAVTHAWMVAVCRC
jgi:hypothetical protein